MPRPIKKTVPELDVEIAQALERAHASRLRRDSLEQPAPSTVLHRIDLALQEVEKQINRHLSSESMKVSSPSAHRLGNDLYKDLGALRRKLRQRWSKLR